MTNPPLTDQERVALEAQLDQLREGIRALAIEPPPIDLIQLRELLDRYDSISEKLAKSVAD